MKNGIIGPLPTLQDSENDRRANQRSERVLGTSPRGAPSTVGPPSRRGNASSLYASNSSLYMSGDSSRVDRTRVERIEFESSGIEFESRGVELEGLEVEIGVALTKGLNLLLQYLVSS